MENTKLTKEDILEEVAGLALSWLKLQQEPGQYEIEFDPTDNSVSLTSTFSGDNSYIPGDPAITLLSADCRESVSPEVVGLTDDGEEIADSETMAEILRLAGEALDEAIENGEWEDPEEEAEEATKLKEARTLYTSEDGTLCSMCDLVESLATCRTVAAELYLCDDCYIEYAKAVGEDHEDSEEERISGGRVTATLVTN